MSRFVFLTAFALALSLFSFGANAQFHDPSVHGLERLETLQLGTETDG